MLIVWTVSFLVSKLPFCEWLSEIAFTGVRKLSRAMSNLSKLEGDDSIHCWEGPFEFWWNFSIKYFVPFALSFLLFNSLKTDIDNPYNNYHMFWQSIGFAFPIAGLLVFIISIFVCTESEEGFEEVNAVFDPNDRMGIGILNAYSKDLNKTADAKTAGVEDQAAETELVKANEK